MVVVCCPAYFSHYNDAHTQTHPHVDKNAWASNFTIGTREPMTKPFPVGAATSVLKWRYATKDESMVPLAVNVWPTPGADGSIECSVEYELIAEKFELRDVVISIPVPYVECGEWSFE